jgi:hypothetical protein
MRHLILALLAATFPLSATAATNLNSSKSNVTEEQAATTVKSSKSNSSDREQAQTASDCDFAIDQKGVARSAPQKECKTFNESRSNNTRALRRPGKPKSGEAGIAVSDPGVPNDKNTPKK